LSLLFAGGANACVGIYEFFGGSGADHLIVNNRFFRAFGTFGQPNPFGAFMGMLIPVAASLFLGTLIQIWQHRKHTKHLQAQQISQLVFYAIILLLMSVAIIASWSRGAWLGFLVSLSVVGLFFPQRLWQSIALFLSGVSLVTIMWFSGLVPTSISARLSSITEDAFALNDVRGVDITSANYAIVERLAHWQAALRMADENPILGVGAGNYEVAYQNYRLINWVEPLGHAHNFYLNVLAETGIIGLITYLFFWLVTLFFTWQARKQPNIMKRSLAIGLLGSWAYIAVHSLTDNLYVNNMFMHFGVLLGLLAVIHRDTFNYFYSEY
jgi:O-antigen ligase